MVHMDLLLLQHALVFGPFKEFHFLARYNVLFVCEEECKLSFNNTSSIITLFTWSSVTLMLVANSRQWNLHLPSFIWYIRKYMFTYFISLQLPVVQHKSNIYVSHKPIYFSMCLWQVQMCQTFFGRSEKIYFWKAVTNRNQVMFVLSDWNSK